MTQIIAPAAKAVVTLNPVEEVSAGGLFIVESAREKATEATVVASNIDGVSEGDTIILSGPYAGAGYEVDGVEYVTVVTDEILAVVG
jgi:co-chaperonin GroES (HSP10)